MTQTAEPTIYQQLKAIVAANPGLLTSFKTDLIKHDRRSLRKTQPGWTYIWGLREHGTCLICCPRTELEMNWPETTDLTRLAKFQKNNLNWLEELIKEHITNPHRSVTGKLALITCTGPNQGAVRLITHQKALELMRPMDWKQICNYAKQSTAA